MYPLQQRVGSEISGQIAECLSWMFQQKLHETKTAKSTHEEQKNKQCLKALQEKKFVC